MAKITALTEDLCRYMLRNRAEEGSVLRDLRRETESSVGDQAGMMISEEQGVLLRILTGALAPRLAIEIGNVHRLQLRMHRVRPAVRRQADLL